MAAIHRNASISPITLRELSGEMVSGNCERGIYTCKSGDALAMPANRVPGMRAAVCHDASTARTLKEMGDSNIISIGARVVGLERAWDLVQMWLRSEFRGKTVDLRGTGTQLSNIDTNLIRAPITWIMRFIGQTLDTARPLRRLSSQVAEWYLARQRRVVPRAAGNRPRSAHEHGK